jgi:hypothetical protein
MFTAAVTYFVVVRSMHTEFFSLCEQLPVLFFRRQFLFAAYRGHKLKWLHEQRWMDHLESAKVLMETDVKYWRHLKTRAKLAST